MSVTLFALFVLVALRIPITDFFVDTIFKNVVEPLEKEMPITVTSFPSSPQVLGIIGGKGEGLNCSLPPLIDYLFERLGSSSVSQTFRQACVFHDLCYRHGLATYGYTQNDCDELLQEQALRICVSVASAEAKNTNQRSDLNKCQMDAKKVAAGVKLGGFGSFQSWDTSTYFEFDTNPYRSIQFNALRVVDHPFKTENTSEPAQALLRFSIMRSKTNIKCLNCKVRPFTDGDFESARVNTTDFLRLAEFPEVKKFIESNDSPGLKKLLHSNDFLKSLELGEERAIWLPMGPMSSAPQLISDGADGRRQLFVWFRRDRIESSSSCVVVADAKHLLTHTRPNGAGCKKGASDRLNLEQVDLLTSSPQAGSIPSIRTDTPLELFGVGLTAQIDSSLMACISRDLNLGANEDYDPNCYRLIGSDQKGIMDLAKFGTFQNFPIIKNERAIFISRNMMGPINGGRVIGFDIKRVHLEPSKESKEKVKVQELNLHVDNTFNISDDYDPMMPVSSDKEDFHLLSAKVTGGWLAKFKRWPPKLELFETNLTSEESTPIKLETSSNSDSRQIKIDASWARRPIIIATNIGIGEPKDTSLVLSRSAILSKTKVHGAEKEEVRLEFALLQRKVTDKYRPASYSFVTGLACDVSYSIKPDVDSVFPCFVSSAKIGGGHATPATRLQGGQLALGRLRNKNQLNFVLYDACFPDKPIIVKMPFDEATSKASEIEEFPKPPPETSLKRKVTCVPISGGEHLAERLTK